MIEFGEIKSVEEPYPVQRSVRDTERYGSLLNPNIGTVLVFDENGTPTDEEVGIRLEDGRFPFADEERIIDMISGHTSQALFGIDLTPPALNLGEQIAFTRMHGFSEVLRPLDLPKRQIEFAYKAGNWVLTSQYNFSLLVQQRGHGIPTLDDDRY